MHNKGITIVIIGWLFLFSATVYSQTNIGDLVIAVDASGSMRFSFPTVVTPSYTCSLPSVTLPNSRYSVFLSSILSTLAGASQRVISNSGTTDDLFDGSVGLIRFPKRIDGPGNRAEGLLAQTLVRTNPISNPFDSTIPTILSDIHDTDTAKKMQISCNPNGTPIGDALILSRDFLNAAPTGKDKQAILLITDGENNRSPYFTCPTAGPCTFDSALNWIPGELIRIDAIGIGDETGSKYDDLQKLAATTSGHMYAIIGDKANAPTATAAHGIWWHFDPVDCPTDPADCAKKILRNFLDVNLFQGYLHYAALSDPTGILAAHQVFEDTTTITSLDKSISYAIHWNPYRGLFHPEFRLILEDGTTINADQTRQTTGYRIVRGFDYIYIFVADTLVQNNYGQWRLQIDGTNLPIETPYSYSIFSRSDLRLKTDFNRKSFITGDKFFSNLQIELDSLRISGAKGTVTIQKPIDWVGNWNHEQTLTVAESDSIRRGSWEPDMALLSRKRIILQRNRGLVFQKRTILQPPISLLESNGNYSFNLDEEISKPGLYEFTYEFTGNDLEGRPFKRQLFFHKYISINVDSTWEHSKIEFEKISQDGNMITTDIQVTVKDKFGNVALPDLTRRIGIDVHTSDGDTLQGELIDEIDGSYSKRITYDETKGKPIVSVSFDGITFEDRVVEDEPEVRTKVTPFAGYFWFDNDLPIKDGPVFGLRASRFVSPRLALETELGFTPTEDTEATPESGLVVQANLNLLYHLNKPWHGTFLTFGVGVLHFQGFTKDETGFTINLGYGAKLRMSSLLDFRADLRDFIGFDIYGKDISHNFQLTSGLVFKF